MFLGIPLFVSREIQQTQVQRFDAITGQPKLLTTDVMKLEILDKEFQQFDTLPDDVEIYEDCPDKYLTSMERWHTDRVSRRIYDWLKSHGVEDEVEVEVAVSIMGGLTRIEIERVAVTPKESVTVNVSEYVLAITESVDVNPVPNVRTAEFEVEVSIVTATFRPEIVIDLLPVPPDAENALLRTEPP